MHLGSHAARFCARLLGIRELLAVIGLSPTNWSVIDWSEAATRRSAKVTRESPRKQERGACRLGNLPSPGAVTRASDRALLGVRRGEQFERWKIGAGREDCGGIK